MNPLERSQWTNLFFLSRSSCQVGMAGGNPAYTTISIRSRPAFGPARKSRSFNQSSPRPAVRTELPTLDSSTRTKTFERGGVIESFFCIVRRSLDEGGSTLNPFLHRFIHQHQEPAGDAEWDGSFKTNSRAQD